LFVAGYPRERISFGSGAAFAAGLGSSALPCVALFLATRPGPPIVEKIRKGGYSILVIGSQGRGYMAEAFLGRVANHVVHRSTIPVLVVPEHP
jgi:nucleotide-binding universal stress UspA family protein